MTLLEGSQGATIVMVEGGVKCSAWLRLVLEESFASLAGLNSFKFLGVLFLFFRQETRALFMVKFDVRPRKTDTFTRFLPETLILIVLGLILDNQNLAPV